MNFIISHNFHATVTMVKEREKGKGGGMVVLLRSRYSYVCIYRKIDISKVCNCRDDYRGRLSKAIYIYIDRSLWIAITKPEESSERWWHDNGFPNSFYSFISQMNSLLIKKESIIWERSEWIDIIDFYKKAFP